MIVQMLKNKEVLQDTSLLSNRYDNKSTNIKINLLDEFISEDYFYYLVCKSPDKNAIQFAIPLVLDVETKSLTFIVKSNITNTIGNWEFCLLIKELAIVDGVINDDGLIAVSEYFIGKVKPGIINENEIGEQPLEEPLQIIYDRLLATEADIKDNENARKVFEEFNIAKSYVIGNKVAYLESSYVCIADCTGILPTDTTKWLLIAKKGEQGIQGLPGNDGYTPIKNIDYFDGEKGDTGDSAYQVWLSQGNIGTVADYLLSLKGDTGAKGDKPNHQWTGTSLQMENPDGSWGDPVDLKGEPGAGVGDMTKTVYDTNNDGKVDKADDSDKFGGQAPAYYAKQEDVGDKTTLATTDKTNLVKAINEVKEQNNSLGAKTAFSVTPSTGHNINSSDCFTQNGMAYINLIITKTDGTDFASATYLNIGTLPHNPLKNFSACAVGLTVGSSPLSVGNCYLSATSKSIFITNIPSGVRTIYVTGYYKIV